MDETYFRKEKEKSLLSNTIIVGQVPSNYEINSTTVKLKSLDSDPNLESTGLAKFEQSPQFQIDGKTCEGLNCYEKVVTVIEVWAGIFGMMKFFLCMNCSSKFLQKRVIQ